MAESFSVCLPNLFTMEGEFPTWWPNIPRLRGEGLSR